MNVNVVAIFQKPTGPNDNLTEPDAAPLSLIRSIYN